MGVNYKRVLLKLSGEALLGKGEYGIDPEKIQSYAMEIKKALKTGVQLALVIGGGNIYRGVSGALRNVDRVQGDYMGMLATTINGLALQSCLEENGVYTRLQTAVKMDEIAEPYVRRKAIRHMEKGRIVIFCAGLGSPYFTTDTAAVLRAVEIGADAIFKGTRVDGVYSEDPEKNKNATRYDKVSFKDVIDKGLRIMDSTAFTLSQENKLPILVFDINQEDNLTKALKGEKIGTIID